MTLSRFLGWEIVAVHALTGVLFAIILIVLLANTGLEHWWVALLDLPVAIFSWVVRL